VRADPMQWGETVAKVVVVVAAAVMGLGLVVLTAAGRGAAMKMAVVAQKARATRRRESLSGNHASKKSQRWR
jgi:hypothetical protein